MQSHQEIQFSQENLSMDWKYFLGDIPTLLWNLVYFMKNQTSIQAPSQPLQIRRKIQFDSPAISNRLVSTKVQTTKIQSYPTSEYFRNALVTICVLFLIFISTQAVFGIYKDMQRRTNDLIKDAAIQIDKCTREYQINKCHPDERAPYASDYCDQMDKCMSRDPLDVALNSIAWATLVAEILNGFVETLSFKSLLFIGCIGVLLILGLACKPKRKSIKFKQYKIE